MADNVTVGNVSGQANDYVVSTDQAASGQVQRTKLTLSADGSDTHAQVDELGVLVNLGAARAVLDQIAAMLSAFDPARELSRLTDTVGAAPVMTLIAADGRELVPQYAFANIAASTTDGAIVGATQGARIVVVEYRLHAAATATNVTFNSKPPSAAGTACSELFACGANSGRSELFSQAGHFATAPGHGLTATTGSGSTVGIGVVYVNV
jgi:hypothetical protein